MEIDRRLFNAIAGALRARETPEFHSRLLAAISPLVPWRYRYVMQYGVGHSPVCMTYEGIDQAGFATAWALYEKVIYRFDPVYHLCAAGSQCGVQRLSAQTKKSRSEKRYLNFLANQAWFDDIAILLPSRNDRTTVIGWGHDIQSYQEDQVAKLDTLLPLLAEVVSVGETPSAYPGSRGLHPLKYEVEVAQFTIDKLTDRELEVVRETLLGSGNARIADHLGIGYQAVKNLKSSVYKKLDITSERELFLAFFEVIFVKRAE